jgi:YbbR domain-containing protein
MKGWLFGNLGWKVLCLMLAFILWVTYSGTQEMTASIAAPVQYRNIPSSLDISSEIVEQVHLHLRGPSVELSRLASSGLPIIVDLSQIKAPGERTFNIEQSNLKLPAGVSLERAIPSQIRVRLESRLSREVPVVARIHALPEALHVVHQEVIPSFLSIVGPESHVARIQHVETDPLDLSNLEAGESVVKTNVFAGDPQVNFASAPMVTVKVTLAPKQK